MNATEKIRKLEEARLRSRENGPSKANVSPPASSFLSQNIIQRKDACACGGGCPRCQDESTRQTNLQASRADDREPLDQGTRDSMEERFGARFDDVRIHHDVDAAQSARELQADAYTRGSEIVFGENQYEPGTPAGRAMLAHELAHVMQSRGVSADSDEGRISDPGSAAEREAHGIAADYAAGRPLRPIGEQAHGVHRQTHDVTTSITETISNAPPRFRQWNGVFGWTSRFGIAIDVIAGTLTVVMRLHSTASATTKSAWERAIESKWSGNFGLHISGPNPDSPETCFPIFVDVQWVDDPATAHYTIMPRRPGSTTGGRAGLGGTSSMTDWGTADTVDVTHEFGHMLGNTEEYFTTNGVDFTFGGTRTGFRDPGGTIMNNPTGSPVPRHYELVRINAAALFAVPEARCTVGPYCPPRRIGPGDFPMPTGDTSYA
jgi:hypothetical protein